MSGSKFSAGYLAETEASHLTTQAIPAAIVVQLMRDIELETTAGRPVRRMFIELSVSEAVSFWRHLGDLIRTAGALAQQPSHADATLNL